MRTRYGAILLAALLVVLGIVYIGLRNKKPVPAHTVVASVVAKKVVKASAVPCETAPQKCIRQTPNAHAVAQSQAIGCTPLPDAQGRVARMSEQCGAPILPCAPSAVAAPSLGFQVETSRFWTTEGAMRRVLPATRADSCHPEQTILPGNLGIGALAESIINIVNNSKQTKPKTPTCIEPV
jgi:hypothetical protein